MNDDQFLRIINGITREHRLHLPALRRDEAPSPEFLADWARFLELSLKEGVALSDSRWQRLSIASDSPSTRFTLEGPGEAQPDEDFRVGLQLLMGMLDDDEAPSETPPE